jgi:hypothetical protein
MVGEPLDLRVRPARRWVVSVRDSEGQAVAGALVEVVSRLVAIVRATTDQQGNAIVSIAPDAEIWFVLATKEGVGLDYVCFWIKQEPKSDPYRLAPDFEGPIELCLNGAAAVKVRVVDDAGRGLAGVEVKPWYFVKPKKGDMANVTSMRSLVRRTDADGVAEFGFIPADCQQKVLFRPCLKGYCAPARCVWDPKSGAGEVKVAMTPVIPVEGTVVHSDGSPAVDATVHVGGEGLSLDRFRGKVSTDERGVFRINVHPEQFYLFVAYKGHDASAAQTRMIRKHGGVEPIQLVLKSATRVHGGITAGPDHAPASGDLRVSFTLRYDAGYQQFEPDQQFPRSESGRRYITPMIHDQVLVDAAGRFEFYVGAGKIELTWWWVAGGPIERQFVIEDQREIELDLHADEAWTEPRTVRGRVVYKVKPEVGVDQANLFGKFVGFERVREPEGTSDAQGNFRLRRNGVSDFYLLAVAPDGMRGMVLVSDAETTVVIEVGPTASLRGRILDERGEPVVGATLQYGILAGEMHRRWHSTFDGEAETDGQGRFCAGGLVPGHDYRLRVGTEVDGSGRPRGWQAVGNIKPDVPGMLELGDLKIARAP